MLTLIDSPATVSSCDFCNEFAGLQSNRFSEIYGAGSDRIIESTASFNVIPSLGQLTEGHLLIIPKAHATAIADLELGSLRELDELYFDVSQRLQRAYGQHVAFEHGTRSPGSGGCGIVHAHLHVVPCCAKVDFAFEVPFRRIDTATFCDLSAAVSPLESYLWFRDQQKQTFVAEVRYVPSQYLRKIVATALQTPEWDWRELQKQESLLRTVRVMDEHAML